MWKKIVFGVVVLLVIAAGGIAFWMRAQDRKHFEAMHKEWVRESVQALDNEDPSAPLKVARAEEGLTKTDHMKPWVSDAEVAEQKKLLEDAKARARAKYPAKALAWKLGETYTAAVVEYQLATWQPTESSEWYAKSYNLTMRLDMPLNLSEFPRYDQKSTPGEKQQFIREHLDTMAASIGAKHGADAEKLFRLGSLAALAFRALQDQNVFPDLTASYPTEIERLSKELGLAESLWQPYVEGLKMKYSTRTLVDRLVAFRNGTSEQLGMKPKT